MSLRTIGILMLAFVLSSVLNLNAREQGNEVTRQEEALAILARCVAASHAAAPIRNFAGSGTMAFQWGKQLETVPVNVRRNVAEDEFHLDVSLPSEAQTWIVDNRTAVVKHDDVTIKQIPHHNAMNLRGITSPYVQLIDALNNISTSVLYDGVQEVQGRRFYRLSAKPQVAGKDPDGKLAELEKKDFLIDASNFLLVAIENKTYSASNLNDVYPDRLYFWDYHPVNGILMPFSISDYIGGQHTWTIKFDSVIFE